MVSITAVVMENGSRKDYPVENWFVASQSPLYLGVITKPSPGIWGFMSRSHEVVLEISGKSRTFRIAYRIEVGESSIFFVTPQDESKMDEIFR